MFAPLELNDFSAVVLATAADEARLRDAPLVLLHVVHDPVQEPGYYERALKRAGASMEDGRFHQLEEVAEEVFDAFLATHAELLSSRLPADRVERRLVVGVPTTRIVEVSAEIGARMVVMGSHGHRGLAHILLGSVAERVARLSAVPVLIVRRPQTHASAAGDA